MLDIQWDTRKILIFIVIAIVWEEVYRSICCNMTRDSNVAIRFLGYVIALIFAVGALWLIFYYCFDINLLEAVRNSIS